MKEFFIKHPWITALLIVPTVVHGAVALVKAVRGDDDKKDAKAS